MTNAQNPALKAAFDAADCCPCADGSPGYGPCCIEAALIAATPHLTGPARADGYREGADWLGKSLTVALQSLPGGALVLLADIVAGAMGPRPNLKEESR